MRKLVITLGAAVLAWAVLAVALGSPSLRLAGASKAPSPSSTAPTKLFPNPQAAPADYQSFYTMPGARVPILTVTTPDRDPEAGDIFTTNGPGPGQYGPLIYTPSGRLVWFQRLTEGQTAEGLSVQAYAGRRV